MVTFSRHFGFNQCKCANFCKFIGPYGISLRCRGEADVTFSRPPIYILFFHDRMKVGQPQINKTAVGFAFVYHVNDDVIIVLCLVVNNVYSFTVNLALFALHNLLGGPGESRETFGGVVKSDVG
jgi:hypothetical protein